MEKILFFCEIKRTMSTLMQSNVFPPSLKSRSLNLLQEVPRLPLSSTSSSSKMRRSKSSGRIGTLNYSVDYWNINREDTHKILFQFFLVQSLQFQYLSIFAVNFCCMRCRKLVQTLLKTQYFYSIEFLTPTSNTIFCLARRSLSIELIITARFSATSLVADDFRISATIISSSVSSLRSVKQKNREYGITVEDKFVLPQTNRP